MKKLRFSKVSMSMAALALLAVFGLAGCGGNAGGNAAPVANAGPVQNISTGSLVTLDGSGSTDANGDTLTYSWSFTSKPTGSTATLSSSTVVNPAFTADKDGAYVLSLVVNDGTVDSAADTVTITAATANSAPVANAGIDQNVATSSLVTLDGSGSTDANSDTLTYTWSFTSTPGSSAAALSSSTVVNPTFTADKDGAYVLSLVVNDGTVDSAADTVTITAFAPGANFKMPDTGQTTSYTNTFGEDHDYSINPPSYTDNGDGTVTDNVTGLTWQKQDDATTRTWDDAGAYCDTSTLGGYSDWRLPSQIELISIIDNGVYNPSINTTFFPGTVASFYWSSTTSTNGPESAWLVGFDNGLLNNGNKSNFFSVRCVRGGQTTQSLTDNGNGTVADSGTLLTWQQGENSAMTWEAALSYCEGLSLAAQTDWRLPNYKELLSLVDYTRYDPSINTTFFPGTVTSSYWSSTTNAGSATAAWVVGFSGGGSGNVHKAGSDYMRCVRGGQ